METLNERIVEQKHDGSEIPCNLRVPKQHLANIAHVSDLGMAQTELP